MSSPVPKNPYVPLPPHAIPEEAKQFLESMTAQEKILHEMAVTILGSSYFVETSHAFLAYCAKVKCTPLKGGT